MQKNAGAIRQWRITERQVTMDELTIEEMDRVINKFIDNFYGTSIGEHIRRWRENTFDTDYDSIKEIYDEVMDY